MAVITATRSAIVGQENTQIVLWEGIATSDSGSAVEEGDYSERSVHVLGTFDSEVITMQGSNDGTNWATLSDLQGSALTFSSAGLKGVAEATRYIRPLGDGAGTNVDLDVYMFVKKL